MKHAFLDKFSSQKSLLHSWDPGIKTFLALFFVLVVTLTPPKNFSFLVIYFLILILLFVLSRLPFGYLFFRYLLIVPVILSSVILVFFRAGIFGGLFYFFKSFLCVGFLLWLSSTTPFPKFLKVLEKLGLPAVFIAILSFMYRYFFILEDELMRIQQALAARTFKPVKVLIFKSLTNFLGLFFIRSYERAERIYLAMLSRGYNGR